MAKIKQSPKLPPELRREQLMAAARELFSRKGYRETTTEEIARRARVTKGALYHHFRSKEDIMVSLVNRLLDRHLEGLGKVLVDGVAPADVLRLMLEDAPAGQNKCIRENVDFFVQAMRIPRIKKLLNQAFVRSVERFSRGIDPRYGSRKQLRNLAVFTFSLQHGLRIRRLLDPEIVDVHAQIGLYRRMLEGTFGSSSTKKRKK
jgi:AcrR family transcriptional regulator